MSRLFTLIVAAAIAVAAPALGQSLTFSPKESGEPVEVTSENGMELHQDAKRVIARGKAKAVQGAVSVTADELIADYRTRADGGNEVFRVFATGNVVMKSENETATGRAAVYDLDKAVLVLEGDTVSLTSPDGQVQAHKMLQYWANEGVAVAEGQAFAEDKAKHRLFADRLVAFFRDSTPDAAAQKNNKNRSQILGRGRGDINYVQGFGNVRMETAKEIIRGERGAYNIDSGMATLDGGVKITQGTNQLSGGFATVNVKGGTSKLFGSAAQAGQPGVKDASRVRALIAPKADPTASPGAP